ncbi:MAG: bifunctional nuclease family protein [Acidobacteriota bacterium]
MTEDMLDTLIPMVVKGLMLDPTSNVPIVLLREAEGDAFLPIWIGVFEANAIALRLESVDSPRPLTHDLLATIIEAVEAAVVRVVISDLSESTFYAQVVIRHDGLETAHEQHIDARPSDAVALALRTDAPIYVAPRVFARARQINSDGDRPTDEQLRQWLEEIDPKELGEYEM